MDRDDVRSIVAEIISYHPATQFVRTNGNIQILVPGGATPEQQSLLTRYQDDLWLYLITPPSTRGQCWREHPIRWVCTSRGLWVCSCYYSAMTTVNAEMIQFDRRQREKARNLQYRDYWTRVTKERVAK